MPNGLAIEMPLAHHPSAMFTMDVVHVFPRASPFYPLPTASAATLKWKLRPEMSSPFHWQTSMNQSSAKVALETDPRFPTGEWSGFFLQGGQRHWMTFYLEFCGGTIRGEGNDFVGTFHLSGRYDLASGYC